MASLNVSNTNAIKSETVASKSLFKEPARRSFSLTKIFIPTYKNLSSFRILIVAGFFGLLLAEIVGIYEELV